MIEVGKKKFLQRLLAIVFSNQAYLVVRFILAGVFIWSGVSKLMDPFAFGKTIAAYGLLYDPMIPFAAFGLPLIEVMAGFGLLFNIKWSLELISGMLLMFIFVLCYGIANNLRVGCGCFSPNEIAEHDSLKNALFRDFFFIGLALYLFTCWIRNVNCKPGPLWFMRRKVSHDE